MSSGSKQLYSHPPTTSIGAGFNRDVTNSLSTRRLQAKLIEASTVTTDSLRDRADESLIDPDTILLDESATQPPPGARRGRLWVRDDTPNVPVFTNDAGNDIEMPLTLATVLSIDTGADGEDVRDVSSLTFDGPVLIGSVGAPAAGTTGVFIGADATGTAAGYVIGASSSSAQAHSVVLGTSNGVTAVSGANSVPSVVIGVSNETTAGGICIGRSLSNHSTSQNATKTQNVLIGSNITVSAGAVASVVAVGNSVSPAHQGTFVGNTTSALGSSNQQQQVAVGRYALVRGQNDIAIGAGAVGGVLDSATSRCVAVGESASGGSAAASAVIIGASAATTANSAVSIGATTQASGASAVAIGSGASASGSESVAIGYASSTNSFSRSVAIGANVKNRVVDEFATLGWRVLSGAATTTDDTQTTVLTIPTSTNENFHVEGSVLAIQDTTNDTFLAVIERVNIRNRTSTVTQSSGIGSTTLDTSDGATGLLVDLNESGQTVLVQVTGLPGETWSWTAVFNIYASPLE